jgi:uncharacterized protein YndB with AHSA1/START domain
MTREMTCTLDGRESAELLPWGGERICHGCFDTQMHLMAMAIRQAQPGDHLAFGCNAHDADETVLA